jgi:putative DNA primase/helicase
MSFIDFARTHGVDIDPNRLFASERIRRTGTVDKPKSTNGAYFWDGKRGWVFNWATNPRVEWYNDPNATPWTPDDKKKFSQQRDAERQRRDDGHQKAAQKAQDMLHAAKMDNHAYLEIKGLKEETGLVLEGRLLIPMRHVTTHALQGVQTIYWDEPQRKYDKKMIYGMKAKDAVYWLGPRDGAKWLVEGYATGLSLLKALRSIGNHDAVVVTFSAQNMISVAQKLQGKVFIFADNDASETGAKAAHETGRPWVMADEVGMDANDLHKKHGLFAVVEKIMEIKR